MDGFSHDGFHATLAGWNGEREPGQSVGRRVDATSAPIGSKPAPASSVLTDGWAAYPNSIRRAFREKIKKLTGVGRAPFPRVAAVAYWDSDQARREKAGC